MTTAADIIKQYGRTVLAEPAEYSAYFDLETDTQTLARIVSDHGNNPLPDNEAEITRKNLGICLAGQDHWWWNCHEHNCNEAPE